MKEIELTRGYVALIDDDDYGYLNQFSWHCQKIGKNWYATRSTYVDKKNGSIYMHRDILNAPFGVLVDHIDGNGLNCQKSNLRLCTRQQNAFNTKDVDGKIKYKGVFPYRSRIKDKSLAIVAKIKKDGKSIWLGTFNTPEAAARAYDRKAMELFGEFACTNFPRLDYEVIDVGIKENFPNPY